MCPDTTNRHCCAILSTLVAMSTARWCKLDTGRAQLQRTQAEERLGELKFA
jgi:hypothetical protein